MSNGLSWHYVVKDGRVMDNKLEPDEKETILKQNEQKEPKEKTKESTLYEDSAE